MASEEVRRATAGEAAEVTDAADAVDAVDIGGIRQVRSLQQERETHARGRLAAELASLPAWGTTAFASWLALTDVASALSSGALVRLLRRATATGDTALQEHFFVALLRRIERQNTHWAARALVRPPLGRAARESLREELKQELTLALWQRLTGERDDAWELYFSRALDFAQRHVAHAYLVRNGYWYSSAAPQPPLLLSALRASHLFGDLTPGEPLAVSQGAARDEMSVAELADLRDLVQRLPFRERVAVVMRFWLASSERDIASALGVTTRTVRNLITRALTRLRHAYGGPSDAGVSERWHNE